VSKYWEGAIEVGPLAQIITGARGPNGSTPGALVCMRTGLSLFHVFVQGNMTLYSRCLSASRWTHYGVHSRSKYSANKNKSAVFHGGNTLSSTFVVIFIHRVSHGRNRDTANRYIHNIKKKYREKDTQTPQPGSGQMPYLLHRYYNNYYA